MPTLLEPVNAIPSTSRFPTMASPKGSPGPVTTLRAPGGTPLLMKAW